MGRRSLPRLADTARRYLDDTMRPRLASPGIERYHSGRRGGGRFIVAAALLAALVAAFVLLSDAPR